MAGAPSQTSRVLPSFWVPGSSMGPRVSLLLLLHPNFNRLTRRREVDATILMSLRARESKLEDNGIQTAVLKPYPRASILLPLLEPESATYLL